MEPEPEGVIAGTAEAPATPHSFNHSFLQLFLFGNSPCLPIQARLRVLVALPPELTCGRPRRVSNDGRGRSF
jgi:hypothetical protein